MGLTDDQRTGIDIALDEATVLGFEVDAEGRIAAATFSVFTLPDDGPAPEDRRVQILFMPVGRVIASLRDGRWDDPSAKAIPFSLDELLQVVQSFKGLPIYGADFIDVLDDDAVRWDDRLSLDWVSGDDGRSHSLTVFQDAGDRILYLRIWFDCLEIRSPAGESISLSSFIGGGRRWWDAFHAGDARTSGYGMFPLQSNKDNDA